MTAVPRTTFILLAMDRGVCPKTGRRTLRYLQWLRRGQRVAHIIYPT